MSFKLKLVAYFVLLSLLPLAAAFAGFTSVVARSEVRVADARLAASLRAGIAAYEEELAAADEVAAALAGDVDFQRALAARDAAELRRILERSPNVRVDAGDSFSVGEVHAQAAERRVAVFSPESEDGLELGTVIASVPFDDELAESLRRRARLPEGEQIVIVADGRIIAGPGRGEEAEIPRGQSVRVSIAKQRYRIRGAEVRQASGATIAALFPQARIDAATDAARLRLLAALLAALGLTALVAYLEGRSIVAALRRLVHAANALALGRLEERVAVRGRDEFALLARAFNEMAGQLQERLEDLEAERRRLRKATARFGEALSATHDVDQLLRVIVDTAVEATRAEGGVVLGAQGQLVQIGDPASSSQRLELPLAAGTTSFGTLVLNGLGFSSQDIETATLLADHAGVALENARLHRIVERQALIDGLTGLANRRLAEERLAEELARAERFAAPLAVVLADLDWFKSVNDRYGHPVGDLVLREFAGMLRASLREIDLAARWGGEEFILILPGTDLAGAVNVADRIRTTLAGRTMLTDEGAPMSVTASFGVAAHPAAASTDELIAAADSALYDAKRAGKDRVATPREHASSA